MLAPWTLLSGMISVHISPQTKYQSCICLYNSALPIYRGQYSPNNSKLFCCGQWSVLFYRDVPTVLTYYSQSMGCGGIYEAKESGSNEWIVLLVYFRYNDYQPQFIRVFLNSVTNIFADFDEHCPICSQWDILCDIPRKYAQRCKVYSDNYVRDLCLMLVSMCFMWDEYIIFFSILFHWNTMAKSALNGMGKYLTWIAWGHTMRPPQS